MVIILICFNNSEFKGKQKFEFIKVLLKIYKELFHTVFKFSKRFIVFILHDFLFEVSPQPFNQVEIGAVRRQKNQVNVELFCLSLYTICSLIPGIIKDHTDVCSIGVLISYFF